MRLKYLLVSPVLLAAGCPKSGGPRAHPSDTSGPVVVTFSDHAISTSDLQRQFNEQSPFVRSHYQTLEKKKEFLETIIQNDLLADEALKAGFDKDQEVQDEFKKAMIQGYIRQKFNDQEGMKSIPESALHEFYDGHRDEFQRPEKVRVQMILFQGTHGGEAKAKADAEQALKTLTSKKDVSAFAEMARVRSDDTPSKMRGGDIDFHTHDELAKSYGEEVANGADALKVPSDISGVLHGSQGYVLLRLEARQPAFSQSFEQVEASLQSRLWNEKRTKLFDDFIKNLFEQAHVKIDDAQLAKIDPNQPGTLSDEAPPVVKNVGGPPPSGATPQSPHASLGAAHPPSPTQPTSPAKP